jgi:hypothetical protein
LTIESCVSICSGQNFTVAAAEFGVSVGFHYLRSHTEFFGPQTGSMLYVLR